MRVTAPALPTTHSTADPMVESRVQAYYWGMREEGTTTYTSYKLGHEDFLIFGAGGGKFEVSSHMLNHEYRGSMSIFKLLRPKAARPKL